MSSVSVSNSFTNSTTADAVAVNQNFADLVSFINGSVPHSDGTGGTADPRGLAFADAADNGKEIRTGTLTITTASGNQEASGNVSFSAMGSVPKVHVSMADTGAANFNSVVKAENKTTTGFKIVIAKRDGTNYANGTQKVDWIAVG